MSRSGYSDDYDDHLEIGRWRGAVRSAIFGKRGQAFLKELAAALDAMPEKSLAADSLVTSEGEFCTLGVLGAARSLDLMKLDPEDTHQVAEAFGIARAMVCEIVYENDECGDTKRIELPGPPKRWGSHPELRIEETPAERWQRMRKWVADHILPEQTS